MVETGLEGADHSNYDGYANSRYVIAVGACNDLGQQSYYSEGGANIAVYAPSNGGRTWGIATVDVSGSWGYNDGDYTAGFGGTSSSCPLVAGVVALMLEKNPNLGWRDVKEILMRSAGAEGLVAVNPIRVSASSENGVFITNSAGLHFSHSFGAGRVDAAAAVNMAANWQNLGPEVSISQSTNLSLTIPDNDSRGVRVNFDFPTDSAVRVESVEFTVNLEDGYRGDLVYALVSPSRMITFVPRRDYDNGSGLKNGHLVLFVIGVKVALEIGFFMLLIYQHEMWLFLNGLLFEFTGHVSNFYKKPSYHGRVLLNIFYGVKSVTC